MGEIEVEVGMGRISASVGLFLVLSGRDGRGGSRDGGCSELGKV